MMPLIFFTWMTFCFETDHLPSTEVWVVEAQCIDQMTANKKRMEDEQEKTKTKGE